VDDHCEALMQVLDRGIPGQHYHVSAHSERSNIEIVEAICDHVDVVLGRTAGSSRDLISHIDDRPGHDRRYAMDSTRTRADLDWQPRHDLESALATVVRWYVEHKDWADAVRGTEYEDYYAEQYAGPAMR
jgi:dTDP-glucose 4,6-dehydratase